MPLKPKKKTKGEKKSVSLWKKLFPTFLGVDDSQANIDILPSSSGYLPGDFPDRYVPANEAAAGTAGGAAPSAIVATTNDGRQASVYPIKTLPADRLARYMIYEIMQSDPTIDSAMKMHISHSLSAKTDTAEILSIESAAEKEDPIVNDLRDTFKHQLNTMLPSIMYNCALYGSAFARIYGNEKDGIKQIRHDYYTHPRFMKAYERAGQITGYTNAYQNPVQGKVRIMEPWKWLFFRIPIWKNAYELEPVRVDVKPFDISEEDPLTESLVETQNYGSSFLESAYSTWIDLMEAILSLNMSRKNAARLERMVGVNTGQLSPQRAAQYLNTIAEQFLKSSKSKAEESLRQGYVQLTENILIPIWGDGNGRLDLSTIEPNPNITAITDIDFIIKRLCSSLGVDPSIVGFSDQLAGGLGEGGWFRLSIIAAIKSHLIRQAATEGIDRLFDIHVKWKFNKFFLPGQKPWRINFHSIASALDREEQENLETRINTATALAQLIPLLDPEFTRVDMKLVDKFIYTDILKIDEEKVKELFPGKAPPGQVAPGGEAGMGPDGQPIQPGMKPFPEDEEAESAPAGQKPVAESAMKSMIYETIKDFYEKT